MFSLSHCDFVSRNSLQCAYSEKTAKSRAEQSRRFGRRQRYQVKNPDFCECLQTHQVETFGTSRHQLTISSSFLLSLHNL